MSNFDKAFASLIDNEGGYVDNPNDPGGETKFGISKRSYPNLDIANLTLNDAKNIYHKDFWNRFNGDDWTYIVSFQIFDAAVNHGIENAIRFAQRACNVVDDGHFGPISMAAMKELNEHKFVLRFLAERLEFMTKLSTWNTFGRGWARRIANDMRSATI